MPVSVLPRLCVALCAAGVSTALPCVPAAGPDMLLFGNARKLFPVVPWLSALDVLGPGDPPVPLIVLPFESLVPATPPAPIDPAELPEAVWADAGDHAAIQSAKVTDAIFIRHSSIGCASPVQRSLEYRASPSLPTVRQFRGLNKVPHRQATNSDIDPLPRSRATWLRIARSGPAVCPQLRPRAALSPLFSLY